LLRERARLLATELPEWRARDRLAISDFWLAQSLAYARVRLAPAQHEAFRRRWEEVASTAARPRLTVMLDGPTEWLLGRVRARGRPEEACFAGELLDRLRQAMLELLRQPGQGPVLYAAHEGPVPVEDEVLAAVQSMK
jgi:deoxyadenosine/deoxycytidine kinase